MTFAELFHYFISLLVICNPAIAVPVLLALTSKKSLKQKRKIGLEAGFAVGMILVVITWLGTAILEVLSVRVASFQVTGGLILLLLALSILNGKVGHRKGDEEEFSQDSVTVVPLAMPLMAGPGAISAVIVASNLYESVRDKVMLSCAAIAIALITALLLYFATHIEKVLGKTGLTIVARLGGLILAAIAIESIAKGVSGLYGC